MTFVRCITDYYRFAAPSQPDVFENTLYPPLAAILRDDVQGQYSQRSCWSTINES